MSGAVGALARRWWAGELGAAGKVLDVALAPAELTYRAVVSLRNRAYSMGALPSAQAALPVISIGNIAVGGTGKTPFANWLARRLHARGAAPALVHGGYAEDEPELHRRWAPEIPVIVARDRAAAVRAAAQRGANVVVLDDAFQHRRLRRDLDIVLVAAERMTGTTRLLPRGPWREPLAALRRADIIVCVRKTAAFETASAVCAALSTVAARPVVRVHLRADGWLHRGAAAAAPSSPALLVSALADPELFEAAARAAGARVADRLHFPDHHAYTAADAAAIVRSAADRPVVTTEKDATKLDRHLDAARVWVLTQTVVVEQGGDVLDNELERLLA